MVLKRLPKGGSDLKGYGKKKRLFGYFQALYMSFYSVDLYVDVRHRWRGMGLMYCLLVSLIFTLPWSIKILNDQSHFYYDELLPAVQALPELTIKEGVISSDLPQPYIIYNAKTKKPFIVIDTSGQISDITEDYYPSVVMLISKNALSVRLALMPTYTQLLAEKTNGKITASAMLHLLGWAKVIFIWSL